MLSIFGGLPGTGKSTLALHLARERGAVYLRIDSIEQALREAGGLINGPEGYAIAYRIAADNLRLGLPVVADSVNPIEITRASWRDVALQAEVPFVEIEITCSDASQHRARIEHRISTVAGLRLPTWADVSGRHYEHWASAQIRIDTAGQTIAQSIAALRNALADWSGS